jgi:fumarylacetoacetase
MQSWLKIDKKSDFSIHNIPFGIFSINAQKPRVASILGDQIIDLSVLAGLGFFDEIKFDKIHFTNRPSIHSSLLANL